MKKKDRYSEVKEESAVNIDSIKNRSWNKVFEVGAPKTGTTSLGYAYDLLGLRRCGWNRRQYVEFKQGNIDDVLQYAEQFDAFEDGPWHDIDIEILDKKFPGSKFILLERDDESWMRSYEQHFGKGWSDPKDELEFYKNKYEHIKNYFRNRPDDLLVMSVVAGDGWEMLCPFLDIADPGLPFPVKNAKPKTFKKKFEKEREMFKLKLSRLIYRWK